MAEKFRGGRELRKSPRRQFSYRAKILTSAKARAQACAIADISDRGARIVLESDQDLPQRFVLLLSPHGGAGRICRLVWRRGLMVGVEFPEPHS
ncbi:MAG: PilZ domain-containing protein [Xanthobacteraceae bacterium]